MFGSTPRNACLLLGLGGSGKTSLIKALTADPRARPDMRTSGFEIYQSAIWNESPGVFGPRKTHQTTLFIADYNGQRFDKLIGSLVGLQSEPKSPLRFGRIDSLIFVVDLFPPPENPDSKSGTSDLERGKRLQENLLSWNTMTIDAVMGFTTDSLKYICLFVNKCDLLRGALDDAARPRIVEQFKSIRSHLNNYSEGRTLKTILGSAESGLGVADLKKQLIDAAHRPNAKK